MLADLHFGKHNSQEWEDNYKSYFRDFFMPLLKTSASAVKDSPMEKQCVLIAGDVFDNRNHIDISVINDAVDVITEISSYCPVIIDTGNHDIYKTNDTDITSLRILSLIPNVYIVKELTTVTFSNDKKFLVVPWVGDSKKETQILRENKDSVDVIITHTEISGMKFNKTTDIIDGVDITTIGKKIYSGHIHIRQDSKKCTYLGAPYALDRNDIGNKKGVYVLHIGKTIQEKFYENNYSPEFVHIVYSNDMGEVNDIVKNNYVDFIYKRSEKNDIDISAITDTYINEYGAKEVKFYEKDNTKSTSSLEIKDIDINNDINDVFEQTITNAQLTEEDMKELVALNQQYVERAKTGE